MKIYTKTGDSGQTGLFGGPRVAKHHPRICAYGAVDELNSALGVARAEQPPEEIDQILARLQNELFALGAELASPTPEKHQVALIGQEHIAALEADIDQWDASLPPLKQFILPAGTKAAAALHLARTICRRAEREVSQLIAASEEPVSEHLLRYLNRLSDLLFVLARTANALANHPEARWQRPG